MLIENVALVSPIIRAVIEALNDGRIRAAEANLTLALQQAEALETAMKFNAQQARKILDENYLLQKRIRELENLLLSKKQEGEGGEA